MTVYIFRLTCVVFLFITSLGQAQTLTSVIIDSASQKPIPYVTVQLKNKGVITNEEGRFTFQLDKTIKPTDSLFISCIGYASIARPLNQFGEKHIVLASKAIDLNPVIVSNKNYSPEEIIELVEENIAKNYTLGLAKKRVFLRETYNGQIVKTDYRLMKSTIEAFNKRFIDSIIMLAPKNNTVYYEALGDLYGGSDSDEQKLDLIKASDLYDKSLELDFENLEERLNAIIKKNVKTDSYFKIKSGLFGAKVDGDELFENEVDSTDANALNAKLEEEKKNKENRKKNVVKYKRQAMGNLYENLPIFEDSDYNVLFKPSRYELALEDFTYLGDAAVYVISFTPKRSEDFKGRLYINSDDFALIRMDYENVKSLRDFSLLGISINQYLSKGKIIFSKDGNQPKYHLSYYDLNKGESIGFKRPIKIIEKNKNVKGRRKQNELFIKVNAGFRNLSRHELVVFNESPINDGDYQSFKENNSVLPTYMPNYDPEFWKGYDIIEPNQAIKEFTSIGETEE